MTGYSEQTGPGDPHLKGDSWQFVFDLLAPVLLLFALAVTSIITGGSDILQITLLLLLVIWLGFDQFLIAITKMFGEN